jgi:signal transduction histidine kinase
VSYTNRATFGSSTHPNVARFRVAGGRLARTIRGVAGLADVSRPAELMPRRGRLAALGLLVVFVVIGSLEHADNGVLVTVSASLLVLGASVLMLQARGLPLLAFAFVAAAGFTVLCNGSSSNVGWFGVAVVCGWCALAGGWALGLVLWAGAIALFGVEWLWVDPDTGWGAWMAGTTFTALACLLLRHELDLVAKLRAAQVGLAERARAEERNRIARELHDVIAHTLIVSQLHVAGARLAVETDPADAARALAEAERLGRESLAEVRRAVGLLRHDGDGGNVAPLPGAADLPVLVERFRSAGASAAADVTLTVAGDAGELPTVTGLAVYRIVQEALTNAAKHARGASVAVDMTVEPSRVVLTVDSAGPPGHGSGLGLDSMRERAGALGGTCESGPGGRGWLVRAELPLGRSA